MVLSRCVRSEWKAEAMASSVDLLDLQANWYGSSIGGKHAFRWERTSLSKHFAIMGVRATGRKSLRATAPACFGTGTMLGQREVENAGEDLSQLFCTGPKHSARDAIRVSLVESVSGRSSGVSTALIDCFVFPRSKRA